MGAGPVLGVIADDFTGATDIASMLVGGGMRVVQTIGVPSKDLLASINADAVVVALKSRSIPAEDAVRLALAARAALAAAGVEQTFFKYCSTFDSTPAGNIGPVADALCGATGAKVVPHLPALPINGRTVYRGHLFVHDALLNESGMEHHPLNPMTDASVVRLLGAQTDLPVGLVPRPVVAGGAGAIGAMLERLEEDGCGHAIGDAIDDGDLGHWAEAIVGLPLVAGGSGVATPLARAHARAGRFRPAEALGAAAGADLPLLVLAGSCSRATLQQIEAFGDRGHPVLRLDPLGGEDAVEAAVAWVRARLEDGPALVHTSAAPDEVREVQDRLGADRAGALAEAALSRIALNVIRDGRAGRLVVAGGETSGAVVAALDVVALRIGAAIAPGVPWTEALSANGDRRCWLALKSGNFGGPDFFHDALEAGARMTAKARRRGQVGET